MAGSQLPLFQRKTYKGIIPSIPMEIKLPAADNTVLQTLPAYYTYLQSGGFSKYTPNDFTGDLKKSGLFLKEKPIKDISTKDIQSWISFLKTPSPKGEGLSAKTISRKLTALGNYFLWLVSNEVIKEKGNPMLDIANSRISSPLPEILFEDECTKLLTTASSDPRSYLLFLLLLETGIKLEELFSLKVSHFDFSNKYSPEMMIKHTGKKEKKSRKLKLPMEIISVFTDYVGRYKVDDSLFPYTQRFIRYLISDIAEKAGVKKKVSAQILRDTCAIRQLKRGEGIERVLQRLGLSESTWEDAKIKYEKLSAGGI
ncbi:MAG: tyrosine-type recombinase/integrase [Thermoproteota archaeon]|nr:tyrosine-type recombinase/integrase [Thermoproteota archaeon]